MFTIFEELKARMDSYFIATIFTIVGYIKVIFIVGYILLESNHDYTTEQNNHIIELLKKQSINQEEVKIKKEFDYV